MKTTFFILIISLTLPNNSFGQSGRKKEIVIIKTELGEIHARLDLKKAQLTSLNFLRYADAHLFDSSCFYRVVRMDMVQKVHSIGSPGQYLKSPVLIHDIKRAGK